MNGKIRTGVFAAVGAAVVTVGAIALGVGTAGASDATGQPPEGARAHIEVSPNPVLAGQKVKITGDCGGADRLDEITSVGGVPMFDDLRVVDDNPAGYTATATISKELGYGVGIAAVQCDSDQGKPEAGVSLVVTER